MTWGKLDQGMPDHPKMRAVGPLGLALQVAAICYCNRWLTDGYLPRSAASTLLNFTGLASRCLAPASALFDELDEVTWDAVAATLVEHGVWTEEPGGYRIHDYLDYQPSKAAVEHEREQKRSAGQAGGLARAKQNASRALSTRSSRTASKPLAESKPVPVPVPQLPLDREEHSVERTRATPKRPRKPETPPPDDLPVTDAMREWAAKEGLARVDLARETAQFLDYHRAKDSRQRDWLATWRTWMRRVDGYTPNGSTARGDPRDAVEYAPGDEWKRFQ